MSSATPALSSPFHVDFTLSQAQIALDALAERTGLSKQKIKDAMNKGACWHHYKGKQLRLRRASKLLAAGTRLQLFYDAKVLALQPAKAELLQDHGRYSLWFKPHGLLAQGSQWGDHCSLLRQAEQWHQREVFLVHRLDGDAAGIMMVAHDGRAAAALSQLFQGRELNKQYQAWVEGELQAHNLRLDTPLDGKESLSWVTTLGTIQGTTLAAENPRSLLDIRIETGRKHQIRRHLAGIGHSIVGDRLYGTANGQPLQLLAYRLSFTCPLRQQPVEVCLPPAMQFAI